MVLVFAHQILMGGGFSLAEHMKLCLQSVVCYTSLKIFAFSEGSAPAMSYAILHMQKLKQQAIKGIQIHNQREKESQTNPDIDETKFHLNYDLVNPGLIDYNEKINKMIEEGVTTGKAIRKDAVKLASFLVTSDSTFFDNTSEAEEKQFFETAYEYFCDEYGKDNIAYAMVHKDEKTPHMHVGFVPITEDHRLSAKDFFGKKQQLVQLQDKFHKHMIEKGFNLERGVSSDKKHIETARFKAETLKKELDELEQKLKENEEIRSKIKKVEDVQFKEIPQNPNLVIVSKKGFEELQKSAKKGIDLSQVKQEKFELEIENKSLKRELIVERASNKDFEKENNSLKKENKSLKQQVKDWMNFSDQAVLGILKEIINKEKRKEFANRLYKAFNDFKEKYFEKNNSEVAEQEKQPSEQKIKRSKGDDFEIER
jgi:hypothetical protein